MAKYGKDLTGITYLITGATAGIGLATARALAKRGATTVMVGHHPEKDRDIIAEVQREAGHALVRYMQADLASQDAVRELASDFKRQHTRLDGLINNVGGFFPQRRLSPDGIEMTFALNHLNVFLLTQLLLDVLQASAPARIVNVASDAHRSAELDFENLEGERGYRAFRAYARSKVAMLLFTYELARRLEGTGVTVNAMHPGFVATNLYRHYGWLSKLIEPIVRVFARSPEEGARTVVTLAASPDVEGVSGTYFVDNAPVQSSPATYDEEAARRLWEISLEMTGLDEESEATL